MFSNINLNFAFRCFSLNNCPGFQIHPDPCHPQRQRAITNRKGFDTAISVDDEGFDTAISADDEGFDTPISADDGDATIAHVTKSASADAPVTHVSSLTINDDVDATATHVSSLASDHVEGVGVQQKCL